MIKELNKNDLSILNNSFIDKKYIEKDFISNPFAKLLVYIEEDIVLGYLYYSDIYDRAEINQIEVETFHRNCGIATKIMKFFTETVDKSISLEVNVNNLYAIKLYENFGFKKVAIRKGYYNGIDGFLMERS